MGRALLVALVAAVPLSGCVSAVKTVVTAPFKVAGAAVDAATTSQAEADRNRGRALRKEEERAEKQRKKEEKEARKRARED